MRFGVGLAAALAFSFAAAALPLHSARAADAAAAGKALFHQRCAICHSDQKGVNKIGPSLFGVVGRPAGSEPGYNYSEANKKSGIVWTPDKLEAYIAAPQKVVPGTKMGFAGLPSEGQCSALIAYLSTLH